MATGEVESFDEIAHRCQPGDTWVRVSVRYFQSEQYADALALFNRNHPQVSESVRREGPTPGALVFIPPGEVLVKRFGAGQSRPAAIAPPMPVASTSMPPLAQPTVAVNNQLPRYLVRTNGESFRSVAQAVLNDRERWGEIADLNRNVNPEFAIPAGTILQLPPSARVPAANVPQ
jgi:hypothetical protein